MIFEHRCYTLKWGATQAFWDAQLARGFAPMRPMLERLVGYFDCQAGPSDQVVHLYQYDSLDDWQSRMQALQDAPVMQSYFKAVRPLMTAQENQFLVLAPLAPLNPLWGSRTGAAVPAGAPPASLVLHLGRAALVEESTQQLVPGALPVLWEHYAQCALQPGSAVTDHLVACFHTLVGRLHQVVHYRSYPHFHAHEQHQARLRHDSGWQRLMEGTRPLTLGHRSKWLRPAAIPELSPLFRG